MQGVQLAHDYSVYLGMPKTQSEVTIYIYHDTEKLISAYARETNSSMEHARTHWENDRGVVGIAIAYKNHFFVNTSNEWYQNTKPKYRMKVIAHEFIHTYQNELSELNPAAASHEVPEAGPRWLQEGIAEYLAYKSLSEGGILSYDSERNSGIIIDAKKVDKPLSEMEKQEGYRGVTGAYNHFLLATEFLAKNSDENALLEYHALQNSKTTWQEAFEKAFGMNVGKFYELFEEHRAAGFPDPNRPTPTGPQTVDDYIVWKVGDEVSSSLEAEVRETVLAVHNYAVGSGMPRIGSPITIFLHRNLDALAAEFEATTGRELENRVGPDFAAGRNPFANGSNWVMVNTSADRYQEWSAETRERQLGGHLTDALQREMSVLALWAQRDQVPPGGPAWLLEGSEKYITYQALRSTVPESCDPTRSSYARISESEDTPLSEAETSEDFWVLENSSAHGFLAVELLAEQADPEAVIAYFAALQPGTNWQETFHAAFGITIEEFYQLFEEHRAAGFPRPRCPTLPPLVTMPGAPEYIKWTIGDEVSAELRQYAVDAARLIHEYATSRGLPDIESEIEIHIHGDLDTLATIYADITGWSFNESRDFWENRGGGVAGAGWVTMPEWTHRNPSEEPIKITRGITHELVHAYQAAKYSLVGSNPYGTDDEAPKHGPRWLLEGSANFFMYKAMDAGGFLSYDSERLKVVDEAKLVAKPLSGLESHTNGLRAVKGGYDLGQLATELLVSIAGEEEAVIRYYTLTQPGTTWQEAFETAFGMPVAEFYELFEEHRAAGFPDPNRPTLTPEPGPWDSLLQDPSLPPYVRWEIKQEVDPNEVGAALHGARLIYALGKSLDIPDPEGEITVYIDSDTERLAAYYSKLVGWDIDQSRRVWEVGTAIAGRGSITIKASPQHGEPVWHGPDSLTHTMAHELVHSAFEHGVLGLLTDPAAFEQYKAVTVPRWLGEGMAELLTDLAIFEQNSIPYPHPETRQGRVSRAASIDLSLQEAETWPSRFVGSVALDDQSAARGREIIDCIYACGYMAVELLASHVGVRKLADYYMLLEPRMVPLGVKEEDFPQPGWREAFEQAFGMTVDEFYDLFEEHRAAGFPELDVSK